MNDSKKITIILESESLQKLKAMQQQSNLSQRKLINRLIMEGDVHLQNDRKEIMSQIVKIHDDFNKSCLRINQNIGRVEQAIKITRDAQTEGNAKISETLLSRAENMLIAAQSDYNMYRIFMEERLDKYVDSCR